MLHDLDELILQCRDDRAQSYIREAVGCYRSASYRSAIVATWIAVAFDIIDKIRELALAGDKEAISTHEEFERIRASNDVKRSLEFERSLLNVARDKFELISPVEYLDLERIQQDRNRCAHPSMVSDSDIFSPPAELARLHIRSAVEHLLKHEPAQGKAALARLTQEISSTYFPVRDSEALVVLGQSPLRKARGSLIRNFSVVLIKRLLDPKQDYQQDRRSRAALHAIRQLHPDKIEGIYASEIPKLFTALDTTEQIRKGLLLVKEDMSVWHALNPGLQTKLKNYVENLPSSEMIWLEDWLSLAPLKEAALARAKRLNLEEANDLSIIGVGEILREQIIDRYVKVDSFERANQWGKQIELYASDYSREEIEKIIGAAGSNPDIRGSFRLSNVIGALRQTKTMTPGEFNKLLLSKELKDFARNEAE